MKEDKLISTEERAHLSKIDNYIGELTDLVLLVDIDSIKDYSSFVSGNDINFGLIIQKILLPFFKMKIRIFKESLNFSIGDINFIVSGLSPSKYGYVSSASFIRLNK